MHNEHANIAAILKITSSSKYRSIFTLLFAVFYHFSFANVGTHVMYEGKHIHFSEVDNKPLCSYSAKLCKQRRLNGYAFCIRHVLEDTTAPFKQCEFVAKYNRLRCTNPIPGEENRRFCNSHMQVLGLVPKRGKKRKGELGDQSPDSRNDTASSKGGSQERDKHKKKSKDKKKKKKKKKKKEKHKKKGNRSVLDDVIYNSKSNFELPDFSHMCRTTHMPPEYVSALGSADSTTVHSSALEKSNRTKSKRRKDGSTLHERLQEKLERNKQRLRQQREKELLAKALQQSKSSDTAASHVSSNLLDSVGQYNNLPYLDAQKFFPHMPPLVEGKGRVPTLPWPQLPQPNSIPREAFVKLQRKRPRDLFARKLDSPAVDRLRERLQHEEVERTDLFPLGLDFSDTDDEESEEVSDRRSRNTYKEQCSLSHISSSTEEASGPSSRQSRLKQLKNDLQEGKRRLELSLQCDRLERGAMKRSSRLLVDAAREHPFGAAVSILRVQEETLQRPKPQAPPERICCSKEENGDPCQEEAMPYSKHCFRHILEDEEQVLFYQCGAEFPGGFRCIEPSFDMLNEQPLCLEHAKRVRMEPKQKRPRKKTKPSALTRPFKKKKKNQRRKIRPQKPIPPLEPLQNYQLPISTTTVQPVAAPHPPAAAAPFRSPSPLGAHDIPVHLMDISALEEAMNADTVDSPPEEELNSDAEEEALSSILPNLNDLFAGKNGDFLPTKEEAEALERALFQASEEVNDAKLSLEQLSHPNLEQFPADNLLLDDGEGDNSNSLPGDVTEAAISQDSSDGLPSDLQSAANRLIADTIRQNSNDGSHHNAIKPPSSNLTNSVPLSNMTAAPQPGQTFSMPNSLSGHMAFTNSVAQFNGTMLPQTQPLLTQHALGTSTASVDHNHHDSLRHTVLNGLISGNRAMVPSSFPVSQPMSSPLGQQVPHPMMSPQSPQIISTTLPQASPSASPGMSPSATAPTSVQATQQTALPSFRQTWSNLSNVQNALRRTNTNSLPNLNGLASNGGLPFGMQITSQSASTQKLPSFNSVVAGIATNHIQQQQQQAGFAPSLPSPQPTSGIPTPPYTAPNMKNITPTIKQQGT